MADKAKRGRLSAIDTLPEWADEAKLWAFEQLRERKLSQLDILDGFNGQLKVAAFANGVTDPPVISRSAFNRTALRVALLSRRLQETREIASVIAPKLEQAGDESLTLMVAETLKTLIAEMLGNAGELSANGATAEMLMLTSRALKHAEEAKRISADGRRKIEIELRDRAVKAVDQVAKEKGLSDEAANAIKAKVLGIRPKQSARP
ncbi:hypothetical protein X566_01335 [Afipia sp. P52-10]|uniref:DUF3486 family protein n=1 Tax=Afipia sp. P52-10 TaxID=1429916 RepID=UPI0003DF2F51|nr:DUF3486 family protein [Afipia sp. P52-10]ETR79273.1 hypothetical protein X566_01335 [Afipia sp. P52-10]